MKVLVDDQLALLAILRALELPAEVERPLLTTYGFFVRVAGAVAVHRPTEGVLKSLVDSYLPGDIDPATLVVAESDFVRVMDPTRFVVAIARIRAELQCNLLAAKVAAVAQSESAGVRLTPGNARGQLWEMLVRAGVPSEVWEVRPTDGRMTVVTGGTS